MAQSVKKKQRQPIVDKKGEVTSKKLTWLPYTIVIVAIVVFVVVPRGSPTARLNYAFLGLTPEFGIHESIADMVSGHVPHITVQGDDFAPEIARAGLPVVIRNSSILNWRAYALWNIDPKGYLADKIEELRGVQQHPNSIFRYFHGDHPMSSLPGVQQSYLQKTYGRVNMTTRDFFQKVLSKGHSDPFLYYADKVHTFGDEVPNDLYPVDFLMIKDEDFEHENPHKHRVTHVWMGPRGATTHTHYDVENNFYVQLKGRKRFLLFPPEAAPYLYLYPILHPGGQQSQVDFEAPNYQEFPLFSKIPKHLSPVVAALEEGDVLYLPPLWFHHVAALTPSVSISVWSNEALTKAMRKSLNEPLPFRGKWSKDKLVAAAALYITNMLDNIGKFEAKSFVREIVLAQRYVPLYKHVHSLVRTRADHPSYCDALGSSEFDEGEVEEIVAVARKRAELFRGAEGSAWIWAGNIVEQVALTVLGKPHLVPALLEDFVNCI